MWLFYFDWLFCKQTNLPNLILFRFKPNILSRFVPNQKLKLNILISMFTNLTYDGILFILIKSNCRGKQDILYEVFCSTFVLHNPRINCWDMRYMTPLQNMNLFGSYPAIIFFMEI